MTRKFILILCSILMLLSLVACGGKTEVYKTVSEGTLKTTDAIPTPSDAVIVTVTGKIGAANVGDHIEMDLKTIESLGLVDYKVTDPFDQKEVVYRGVLMSKLVALWKLDSSATLMHVVALNDYAVDVPIADFSKYPVIFATQADGVYMPVETRGPAMLVYPYNDFTFDQAIYNDYWAWQIKSIEVQ